MLFRFSLYGFLKNQRYFEAFLVLAFLEKGLSFFEIGLLVAARELVVNGMEIPSGAIADVAGRRRCMILSFAAYIASFVVLGFAASLPLLATGMLLFGIGDSFRTGTHKAMIFAWLRSEGRESERVSVYGYTRSWSKFGSAVSVLIAAAIVLAADAYTWVFFLATVPYAVGIMNFLGYPKSLDRDGAGEATIGAIFRHMLDSIREAVRVRPVRRLMFESMGFDGVHHAVKNYLQPVVAVAALSLGAAAFADLSDTRRTALLVAPVYFVLEILAGVASRNAHRVSNAMGGEDAAARALLSANALVFAGLLLAGVLDRAPAMIVLFVVLAVLHNLWRPTLIARFDTHGTASRAASLLSVEHQSQRAGTMVIAPLLGLAVDASVGTSADTGAYGWVGAAGLIASLALLLTARPRESSAQARS